MPDEITRNIVISIVIIVLVFLFLGGIILAFVISYRRRHLQSLHERATMQQAFQQQLLQSQIETQEETFSAISKELHDNIGQLLNSTKLLIGITQRTLKEYPDTLVIADETLGTAISELRSLSKTLDKEWLQRFSLVENLETEVKRIHAADGMQVHFTPPASMPFRNDEQIILFRIVQEALQNAIKHALAKQIFIDLYVQDATAFMVCVRDDGQGMPENHAPTGLGMLNMEQRAGLLGGTVHWQSGSSGTTVTIQLPIQSIDT